MYDSSSAKPISSNQLAIEAFSLHDIGISNQGIDERFTEHTHAFPRHCQYLKKLFATI
jgi:hypothetical protein